MALRTWARMLLLAVGAAALVATSQLGVAYGLGVVRLARPFVGPMVDHWPSQLTWFAWFAMISAAAGAGIAGHLVRRQGSPSGQAVRAGLSVAAALGAGVVAPLAMQPARTAQVAGTDTVLIVGLTALLGALVGGVAGYAVLTWWTARLSVAATGAAMWLLAAVSVLPSLRTTDPLPAVRLGGIDATVFSAVTTQRFALFTMPAIALIGGALLGWSARRRELGQAIVATAGLAGPALLAAAYLIGGPGDGDQKYQSVPYWAAIGGAFAGVLGSVLASMIRRSDEPPTLAEPSVLDNPSALDQPALDDPPAVDVGDPTIRWEADGAAGRRGAPRSGPTHDERPGYAGDRPPSGAGPFGGPPPAPVGAGDPELSDLFARRTIPAAPPPADPRDLYGQAEEERPGMSSLRRRRPADPADDPAFDPADGPPTDPPGFFRPDRRAAGPRPADPRPADPRTADFRREPEPPSAGFPGRRPADPRQIPRTGAGGPPTPDPVPRRDADYVDWVSGLNDD